MPLQKNIALWVGVMMSCAVFGQPKPHAKIIKCSLKDSLLEWSAVEDSVTVLYYVQQFRWNRWISWDSIKGLNKTDTTKYSCNIGKYIHSGTNRFRIQTNQMPKVVLSQTVVKKEREEKTEPPHDGCVYGKKPVDWKKDSFYELYDQNGKLMKKGYASSIYINDLPKGIYYLNYDNKMIDVCWY